MFHFAATLLVTCIVAQAVTAINFPINQSITESLPWETIELDWGTPVYSTSLWPTSEKNTEMNDALRRSALAYEQSAPSVSKSNMGGFQSKVFNEFHPHNSALLQELQNVILAKAKEFYVMGLDATQTSDGGRRQREFLGGEGGDLELFSIWININRADHFNNPHTHSDCFMSGAYYVTTGRPFDDPAPAASIVFSDPRAQPFSTFDYADWFGMQRNLIKEPKPGMLVLFPSWLMHRVEAVAPDESERISISFNIRLRPARVAKALATTANDAPVHCLEDGICSAV